MKRRWALAILSASALLCIVSGFLLWRAFAVRVAVNFGASIWEVLTALGTVSATAVAVYLAWATWRQRRDAVARLVSAWVTEDYLPQASSSTYHRIVTVH